MQNHTTPIIFDFGGVLMDWDPRYLYRKLFESEAEVEAFLKTIGFFEWNINQDRGYPFSKAVAEHSARHPEYAELIAAYHLRYPESLNGAILPTVAVLRELKEAGYPLYALSNWSNETFLLVRPEYEFFEWFDDIVVSGAVQLVKPDPAIFRLLLERIGRPAGECIFIDDGAKNIQVAQELGFRTIHFQSGEQLRQELRGMGILLE